MNEQFRQGDVMIRRIDEIPEGGTIRYPVQGRLILQAGEATGHHHSVAVADAEVIEVTTADAVERFLRVHRATAVEHQEHAPITLPPGDYAISIQREYTPQAIRRVVD